MKKTILFISTFILFLTWCTWVEKIECKDRKISIPWETQESIYKVCNYKEELVEEFKAYNYDLEYLFEVWKIDKKLGKHLVKSIDTSSFWKVYNMKLYYILKQEYNMTNDEIKQYIQTIDKNYKQLQLDTWHIILWENLLTIDYSAPEEEIEWWFGELKYLSYEHIKYLDILFQLEPQRFEKITLVSPLDWIFTSLKNDESKELYMQIFTNLLEKLENPNAKSIIGKFLDKNSPE
jgi:hypothetical protein